MLLGLRIANIAVMEEAEVAFGPGLTVLTGETGAGKSILVDALGLLLGGRADPEVIRSGCAEATVDGTFERTAQLAERLSELGLPDLGEEVSVRRTIGRAGRGKAYVNGALVTVGVLARLLKGVVDISGQHEHMALFDPSLHGDILDRVGDVVPRLGAFASRYAALGEVVCRMEALGGDERQVQSRLEFLQFQEQEIAKLSPKPGEDLALDAERRRLGSAEKLKRVAMEAEALLESAEGAALEQMDRALGILGDGARVDPTLEPLLDGVRSARAELQDRAQHLSRYAAQIDADPGRLAEVEERLDAVKRLCRKHGRDPAGLLALQQELAQERERLSHRQTHLLELEKERAAAEKEAWAAAEALHSARIEAACAFEREVRSGLSMLGMGGSLFRVSVSPQEVLRPSGADSVEFLFSANPGEPPRTLSKVASGGEASRLFLAMKRSLAGADASGCAVLDEADSGLSGAAAEAVGRMIREVSAHRQVLCITHLPQVAAFADHHLLIEKERRGERTHSRVVALDEEGGRTRELARMLSGVEVTREALGAAEALLRSAHRAARVETPRRAVNRPRRTPIRKSA